MLKVLIADDEYKVGFLVKSLIEWDRLNLEFTEIVQDGATAYQKILEHTPDIVITDIRMPGLSGLDLIKKVTEENRPIHFIVISGYKYFEYAQQAIKYGVEDYLLKPIDEVELNSILKKIADEEYSRRKEMGSADKMAKKLRNSRYILHREFLNSIMHGTALNLEEVNRNYGLNFQNGIFRVICCKLDRDMGMEKNEDQANLILKKSGSLLEQSFSGCVQDFAITYQKHSMVTAILNYESEKGEEADLLTEKLCQHQMDYLSGFEHYRLTLGVSTECGDFTKLHVAVEMAREAAACRILFGAGRKYDCTSISRDSVVCAEDICSSIAKKLTGAVETARYEDITYIISSAFHEAGRRRAFASEYYELAGLLFRRYLDGSPFHSSSPPDKQWEQWFDCAGNCSSVAALSTYVGQKITGDLKSYVEANQEKERKPVLSAEEFIKKNYSQKLSLEELAELGGFNMNYFSELFKKETGKTFTAYVTDVRMEEAKKLLRDTGMPVYEVAEAVGYKDPKFFSQQFIKNIGIKPMEYRKLYY